jgi:hypothetical protein
MEEFERHGRYQENLEEFKMTFERRATEIKSLQNFFNNECNYCIRSDSSIFLVIL